MEQAELLAKLRTMKAQILRLTEQYELLEKAFAVKESEIELLRKEIVQKDAALEDFRNSRKISNIVNELSNKTPDAAELKLKINGYIREIDRCIAHLEQSL